MHLVEHEVVEVLDRPHRHQVRCGGAELGFGTGVEVGDVGGECQLGIHVAGQLHREAEVFGGEREVERVVVAAVEDLWAVPIGDVAAAGAVADDVEHLVRGDATLDAEHQGLGQADRIEVAQHHLGDLGDVSGAVRTEQIVAAADRLEHRQAAGMGRCVSADEHAQRAGLGPFGSSADRCVEHAHAVCGGERGDLLGTREVVGAQVDPRRTRRHRWDDLLADCQHLLGARQRGEHDIGIGHGVLGVRCGSRADRHDRRRPWRRRGR